MGLTAPLRLFVAVAVPPAVQEAVAAAVAPLHGMGGGLRWTDPAGWHLTVAFLGQTDPAALSELTSVLTEITTRFAAFDVQLRPVAGRNARSGVLWIELEPCEPFQVVAAAVDAALNDLGIRTEDRALVPHLTLARARTRGSVPRSLAEAYHGPAVAWTVPGLELIRSHMSRAGARYETVALFRFAS